MENVAVTPSFWTNRRVLVTGHTGFKGSWLSLWLQRLGADVVGFSIGVPTSPSLYELAAVETGMRAIVGDVRNRSALVDAIETTTPEIIIHLAAQAIVQRGYEDPIQTFETNVIGTLNLLEAIRQRSPARVVLVVTSDKCYRASASPVRHTESDALGGADPYSSSKACAELATEAYRSSYFERGKSHVAIATARSGNVIGGGDWTPNRIMPDTVRAFANGLPAFVRNPQHVRPWQHVLDPISGYLILCENLFKSGSDYAEAWNFGPVTEASEVPVAALVEKAAAVWGRGASWRQRVNEDFAAPAPQTSTERAELRLNPNKAMRRLGWAPRLDLDASIRWTVEWYQRMSDGRSPRSLTLGQIDDYSS